MNEVLFSKIQNVLLDLVCNKTDTMTVDDATNELVAIFEAAQPRVQADDANTERHGQTTTDNSIYSTQATGATPRRR